MKKFLVLLTHDGPEAYTEDDTDEILILNANMPHVEERFTKEWQDAFPEIACYLGLREYGN